MTAVREFFPRVKKTVIPRPAVKQESDVLGQTGSARAAAATIYGPNWHHDSSQDLVEIWDAGPALCFKDVIPKRDKYTKEGLYLRLSLAYRTTPNACANIRTFSGNNVTLPNAVQGAMYEDPFTRYWVTEDCTLNVNSVFREERIWIQRVDWEWVSQDTIYEDELSYLEPFLYRKRDEVEALYAKPEIDEDTVRAALIGKIREDPAFAKRCLVLLGEESLLKDGLVSLYRRLGNGAE